jgi:diguanylate cyclase (GGDEF)-like protein
MVAEAALARFSVFRDLRAAKLRWDGRFPGDMDSLPTGVAAWVSDFHGVVAYQSSEFGTAVRHFIRTHDAALASGQISRAITAATNIGNSFTSLNDHHTALEWNQRGLALARQTGWPLSIAGCLMQTAETLRHLGRLDAASQLLREALDTLAPLPGSRDYAIATEYLGDVALDRGDHAAALDLFKQLGTLAQTLHETEFLTASLRGQAHALSCLGRPEEALVAASAALGLSRQEKDAYAEVATLKILARIHGQSRLPMPAEMSAGSASLHYLQQALAVAATIEGYIVPGDLLDAIAQEYAGAGDYEQAYDMMLRANAARVKTHSHEATNRAIAMQVQHQTERERAEAEYQRRLAAAEARRSEVLMQTNETLERLGAIGQEITAHLDADAVFRTIERHVRGLLDARHFAIYVHDAERQLLRRAFGVEDDKPVPTTELALSNPNSFTVRCVRERRQLLIDFDPATDAVNIIPGTQVMLTQLFAPLTIGERVLGVMTVQSTRRHAYGEREQLIFRTLCSYGAIALDNAAAYRRLEAAHRSLNETKARLEEASVTDSLTGLRNRRFLMQHIDSDVAIVLRQYGEWIKEGSVPPAPGADLVFFMVDLDHFKSINDNHGHNAGDGVLVQVRQRLRQVFRDSDHIVRWGGEEFLVVARGCLREEAPLIAERVRAAIAQAPFTLAGGASLRVTCSIGFAAFPLLRRHPRLLGWPQVVELADQSLYKAKRDGRNRWTGLAAPDDPPDTGAYARFANDAEALIALGHVTVASST